MCLQCVLSFTGNAKARGALAHPTKDPSDHSLDGQILPGSTLLPAEGAFDQVGGSVATTAGLSDNAASRAHISSAGDQDWYRVTLVAGQQYTFALNGFGTHALRDGVLRLVSATGVELAVDDDSGPLLGARLSFAPTVSGTYYVTASAYASETGQYIITMNNGAVPYVPVVTASDVADYLTNTYWEVNGSRDRHWASGTILFNVMGLEPERAALARLAFQSWADVANLAFVETTGAAQIIVDDNQAGAYSSSTFTGAGVTTLSTINVASSWYGGIDAIDSYTYQTFIHEIGHSLGLGHAGPYNGSAIPGTDNIYANDSWQLSLMSYMDQNDYGGASYRFVTTPQIADILAIQRLYGAAQARENDTIYGAGATAGLVYNFGTYSQAPSFTIYDTGGTDKLDASVYTHHQSIDLRPGSFSSIGGLVGNIGIFVNSIIEDAAGGAGNDTIIGNDAANRLWGGLGNDVLDGGAGIDYAVFSGFRSAYTIGASSNGGLSVVGPDGSDALEGIEWLVFGDQTIAALAADPIPLTLLGGPGDDSLVGDVLDDIITGGSGHDILTGRGGSDRIDGGQGTDTAVFEFVLSQYDVLDLGTHVVISSADGVDVLTGIERLRFADGVIDLADGNALFDSAFYSRMNLDVFHNADPYDHYQGLGWKEGRDPNEFFSSAGYLAANADVRKAGLDPLQHYHNSGWAEGRDPGPNFDTELYLKHNPDVAAAGIDPLLHYLSNGRAEGRAAYSSIGSRFDDLFDFEYYAFNNLDVARSNIDVRVHFEQHGWKEGRNPNAFFDVEGYLARNADVAAAGIDPLGHYHLFGWKEGRQPSAQFDANSYLATNADVASAGMNPLEHYLKFGADEGRVASLDGLWH